MCDLHGIAPLPGISRAQGHTFVVQQVRAPNKSRITPLSNVIATWWEQLSVVLERILGHRSKGNGVVQREQLRA
eukprot:4275811-Pyramimonas_sp.AAC.1